MDWSSFFLGHLAMFIELYALSLLLRRKRHHNPDDMDTGKDRRPSVTRKRDGKVESRTFGREFSPRESLKEGVKNGQNSTEAIGENIQAVLDGP